ncbi:hypothetical protein X753_24100 [Mesorhizobium sp. LNJC399B00]|uniref:hypothetical protein n=1 Tax=unclassified Mesorhizobium TaxID=325217 RepID=UPI0003CE97F9|nr:MULTISPECIES: hypothetical protein [unclassified Mesorhizobium]ESY03245.1 hypothetical protein X753_24100 [Mesorhizobium sp. LNJC399B00]WJI69380.1 hypothetical protein NLY36_00815 [Mesorhizobium sp. C399B]
MTPAEVVKICQTAFRQAADSVLERYKAALAQQGLSDSEKSKRLGAYSIQIEAWFKRSVDAVKRKFPVH